MHSQLLRIVEYCSPNTHTMFPLQSFLLALSITLCSSSHHSIDNDTVDGDCWPFCRSRWSGGKMVTPSYTEVYLRRPEIVPPVIGAYNEGSKMDAPAFLILILVMVGFSLAIRHMNDFFAGNTITLVKEGTWGNRFRRRGDDKRFLGQIEGRFDEMFTQLQENEERMRIRSGRPLETDWHGDVDTDGD